MKSSLPPPLPGPRDGSAESSLPPVVAPMTASPPPVASSSVPPVAASASLSDPFARDDGRLVAFLQQAQWVLADQRGMTVKAQMMISAAARDLGISEEQAADAIRSLQQGSGSEIEPPPIAAPSPPPSGSPPRQSATPQWIFRAYLGEALAKSSGDEISERKERQMIEQGTQKLGLAAVFARQIVHEVAAAMGKRLASAAEDARSTASGEAADLPADALGEFLERAAAILTEQRGMNARSRVLLAAAAASCGLSESQADRAMQLLQGEGYDPHAADARQAEREQAFRDELLDSFRQLPHRLLHARDEQRWQQSGTLQYGLPAERVAEWIAACASQAAIRVISTDKASGHVYALALDMLDQGYRLERAVRTRILLEGSQWGLSEGQVDAILQDAVLDHQHADTSYRRWITAALVGGGGLFAAILLALVWFVFSDNEDHAGTDPSVSVQTTSDESTLQVPSGQEWWTSHEDLVIAATKVRIIRPDLRSSLARLGSSDAEQRKAGYQALVPATVAGTDLRVHGMFLRDFFSGCLALDPADTAADSLVDSLLGLVPRLGEPLPSREDVSAFEVPFWAVRAVLDSFSHPQLPDERGDRLAAALALTLGIRIDRRLDRRELERQCMSALCQQMYGVIIAGASSQPQQAAPLFIAVTRHASRYLDSSFVDQRTADLLTRVLPAAEGNWRDYEYLLQFAINSNQPLVVLRIVDLYEQSSESELQSFLADRLLRRARLVARSVPRDEVAQRVREALGVKQPVSQRQRWNQLRALVRNKPLPDAGRPAIERLQWIVDTVHAGTLACALARGETGHAAFDEAYATGPAVLSAVAVPAVPERNTLAPRVSASVRQHILNNIANLSDMRTRRRESAPMYLRYLATIAPQVPDLPREPAERLARYLLTGKSDAEHEAVLQHAHAITRWPNVRLALVDQVMETSTGRQRVAEVINSVLGRNVDVQADGQWRIRLRDALLLDVIEALNFAMPPTRGPEQIYDDLADILREAYATRARLLGVNADQYSAAATGAELLRSMVEHEATRWERDSKGPASPPGPLKDWSEKLIAIDYVAENDLQRTVLLQRMWLSILVARLEQTGEIPANQGTELLAPLTEADRQAADLIQQLAEAERVSMQIWLLNRDGL